MDILKNSSIDTLKKTNFQENWNHNYVEKFNVSNFDIDKTGNVFLIENVDIHVIIFINILSKYIKKTDIPNFLF